MPKKERTEVIDGVQYTVTTLPSDPRLGKSATRKRTLWAKLTSAEKAQYLRDKKRIARKKRRRKRR